MRTLFAPPLAFAFAAVIAFVGLLIFGIPPLLATLMLMPVVLITADKIGFHRIVDALATSAVITILFGVTIATAQSSIAPSTSDTFSWGNFIGQVGVDIVPWAAIALIAVVTAILPAPVKAFLTTQRTQQVEQLLERALGFGAAQLQDKLKGQTLTLDLHNQIVAAAVDYAWQHGSKAVLDFLGGQQALAPKLAARVLTSASVQAAQGNVAPAAPGPAIPAA